MTDEELRTGTNGYLGIFPTLETAIASVKGAASARRPFSNGAEWDAWSSGWCNRCADEDTCPILDVVFIDEQTPAQWVPGVENSLGPRRYSCTDYRGDPPADIRDGNPCSEVGVRGVYAPCQGTCGLTIASAYLCDFDGRCGPCHHVDQIRREKA